MTVEREALRDWHRLFGLLLTDFFTDGAGDAFVTTNILAATSPTSPSRRPGRSARWAGPDP